MIMDVKAVEVMRAPLRQVGRLQFIDFARGLVMVIMAWDHVSGFWMAVHGGARELMPMAKDGHDMVYQTFTLVESEYNIPAIIGSWYCEESGKFLMLYLVYVPDVSQPETISPKMESVWLGYLECLTYH
jgi:hypothetical protein